MTQTPPTQLQLDENTWTLICLREDLTGRSIAWWRSRSSRFLSSWEYQAVKTKLHIAQTARLEIALTSRGNQADAALKTLDSEIAKYTKEAPQVQAQAKDQEALYDALNIHDDQFDMSDALISIAVSLAAVAALVETRWLLYIAWVAGGFGVIMGLAGFLGWSIHPDFLAKLLS